MTDTVEVRMHFNDPSELAERYTAVWMEPDGDRRRKAIADVWSDDAIHILQPTQEVYEAAAERAVNPTWQVRGHDELEARVTSAYEDFVATGQMSFRARDGAKRLGDVVTWRWEGVSPDGEVLGAGLEFVILAADDRMATDYQFVELGEVLLPCARSGLAKVGVIAIDGSKVQANASRDANVDYEQLAREIVEGPRDRRGRG